MKLIIYSVILAISMEIASGQQFKVSPKMDIIPIEENSPSDLGIVGDVRNCGGPGQVVQWRYEPCNGESPCKIPGDGQRRRSEVEFIPSSDIRTLGVRFNVITETGSSTVYNRPLVNSSVQSGKSYVASGSGGPPKEMVGKSYTFQYILYNVETTQVEICAEADFTVVEP